ncbi:MAG: MarR family transcriptional regulator [Anaerolineaceae bacterium]|nr:MarR family transcriptional regulator [Anaerolineaceae bacterium]
MKATPETIQQTIDQFWQTFPPLWREVRVRLHSVVLEKFDITFDQFHTLRRINHGHDSVSKLANDKRISRPAISRSVDTLVNKGLVTRTTNPDDRRQIALAPSEKGSDLLEKIFEGNRVWMAKQFAEIQNEDLEKIIQAFETLRTVLLTDSEECQINTKYSNHKGN